MKPNSLTKAFFLLALTCTMHNAIADEGQLMGRQLSEIENFKLGEKDLTFTFRKDGSTGSITCTEWGVRPFRRVYAVLKRGQKNVWFKKLDNLLADNADTNHALTMDTCRTVLKSTVGELSKKRLEADLLTSAQGISFVRRNYEALPISVVNNGAAGAVVDLDSAGPASR